IVVIMGAPLTVDIGSQAEIWTRSTNNFISILVIALTSTLYSTTGGLRSVVATDVVQFALGLIGSIIYALVVVHAVGGLPALTAKLAENMGPGGPGGITFNQIVAFTPSHAKDATMTILAVMGLQWLMQMNADGSGYLAQRTMACRSDRDAKQASIIFVVAQVLLRGLTWLPIALGLLVLFPPDASMSLDLARAEREATFVRGIVELLPPGAKGLMMVGMLAALASTIDTHLNWGSSYWTNDIYKRFICKSILKKEASGRSLVWVARLSNIMILSIAIFVMTKLGSIQDAWKQSLLFGAGIGVVLLGRWLWWRINVWGEISCLIVSLVMVPILMLFGSGLEEGIQILTLAAVAAVVCLTVTLSTPPESMEKLSEFYTRVKPPGFWSPVARHLGVDQTYSKRVLIQAGSATVLSSFAIFCLLAGLGSLICNSPPPVWFPFREIWIGVLITLSIVLTPIWWRLGFTPVEESEIGAGEIT
ncbi:MAG: hypothetical protein K8F91_02795, partial [Candidatus Obscuribacterales bacterium]|nr:hypothetical protein [Candidatus Obscuribacterales bacterium]